MSKIFRSAIAIVVMTVMIEPLMMGTIMRKEDSALAGPIKARCLDDLD